MDATAAAIADPIRRAILTLLRDGPLPAGAIARRFPVSRPAVSRHLRVLRDCGLVADAADGRRRVYRATPAPLGEVAAWIAGFDQEDAWRTRLDALDLEVRRTRRERDRPAEPVATGRETA
jgi:DNA-binding transcriptional ArsR family regulator